MKEQTFSGIVDAIYDAATAFERWPVTLDRLGKAFGCSYVGLIDRNLKTMEARAKAIGIDAAGQREYFEVWSKHDLLRTRTRVYRPGAIETDQDILPRQELVRSDYYNAFLKPHDMHAVMRMTLAVENTSLKIISLSRPRSLGDFETSDIEKCRLLMPHLQRASRVAQQVEESSLNLNAFSDLIEQSTTGVLLLGRTGKIVFANRAAQAMAQENDGFVLRGERIEALNNQNNEALRRLIADAIRLSDRSVAARGGVLRLGRLSGKPDFAVAIAPLTGQAAWSNSGPVAFVLITDPDAASTRPREMITKMFGLSASETRVAERLMLGESPEQAANSLGLKISTARWHLRSMYRKTGASGQTQLVRLLLSVPTV